MEARVSSRWRGSGTVLLVLGPVLQACAVKVVEDGHVRRPAVQELVSTVGELRGLSPSRTLRVALEGPAVLRARAEKEARDPARAADLDRRQKVWAKLGVLPPDVDLVESYRRLTAEAPYGYYDSSDEVLRLVARPVMRSEIMEVVSALRNRDVVAGEVLAHEVCHALQDMHFDLDRLDREAPSDDARLARRALVEGDASLVGFLYSATFFQSFSDWVHFLQRRGARAFRIEGVPDYLSQRSLFPYLAGGLYVAELYAEGGFSRIDAAYQDLPASTEQILHPELRGLPQSEPQIVVLPAADAVHGNDVRVLAEDSLGEFGLRVVLTRELDAGTARVATEGWGGDRYRVVQAADGVLGLL